MKRVTAWFDKSEFENVYRELFSPDLVLQRHAVDRIAVWKCRLAHKISAAVECTSELVSACLLDEGQTSVTMETSELHVRLTYAMALIRFVNLLTENLQKGRFTESIHILGDELGIPRWVVNLRHEATHKELPSLNMLRTGVNFALEWLRSEYWEKQMDESTSGPDTTDTETDDLAVKDCVREYMNHKFKEFGKKQFDVNSDAHTVTQKLDALSSENRKKMISLLVKPGRMIHTANQLKTLGVDQADLLDPSSSLILPQILIKFWKPLLGFIHHQNLTYDLILAFVDIVCGESDLGPSDRMAMGWIFTILNKLQNIKKLKKGEIGLYKKPCNINYRHLCEHLLKKPTKLTLKLLPSILENVYPALTKEDKTHIMRLTEIQTGFQQNIECHLVSEEIYSKESLQKELQKVDGKIHRKSASRSSDAWRLCQDDVDWSSIPLGVCPGVDLTFTSLELPFPEGNDRVSGHAAESENDDNRETGDSQIGFEDLENDSVSENMEWENSAMESMSYLVKNNLDDIVKNITIFS